MIQAPATTEEFVIRLHKAKRAGTHHDLHLNGETWAVPRFVPKSVGPRVLAIKTTYHGPEERRFAGTIPDGQYGAGTSEVVEEGELQIIERTSKTILFKLLGGIFRGNYYLRHWTGNRWLLWKTAR